MKTILLLISLLISQNLWAVPAQVILIRHGEKPVVGDELNARGWQRARALPLYFALQPELNRFGAPAALYAMIPPAKGGSVRAIQTLMPTSDFFAKPIVQKYVREQIVPLVTEIWTNPLYEGKSLIICWEHKMIPEIARTFGFKLAPDWSRETFDRSWVLRFQQGRLVQFLDLPQRLLPGDSFH